MNILKIKTREVLYMFLLVFFGLAAVIFLYPHFFSIGADGAMYSVLGKNLMTGGGLNLYGQPHTYLSPLFPFFIGVF